jgi:hypothetical protein
MSVGHSPSNASKFVTTLLPRIIAAGGLLVYVITLNHWASLRSIGIVARTSGWLWWPQLDQPLTAILLSPFRFLPVAWIPLALNFFNATCAALALGVLARSVTLLPHDLAPDGVFNKRQPRTILSIRTAWMPPVLAAILFGLQLSFWEHATSVSGEMIDLLVLAFVIRFVLEFRMDRQQSWLYRAAFLYGAGMANNAAMIGFLPVFVAACLRLKGYELLRDRRFPLRMGAWGLAGLSLYLLLPTIQSLAPHSQIDFWTALKAHLKTQKETLSHLQRPALVAIAIASLFPLLLISMRWKAYTMRSGDDGGPDLLLTRTIVHLVHAVFLIFSVGLSLEPSFGPRSLALGTSALSFYYLWALAFGYCVGYFLLFNSQPEPFREARRFVKRWQRRLVKVQVFASRLVVTCIVLLFCGLPVVLVCRNFRQIITTNGPLLRQFANDLATDLPPGKSVVLSDTTTELFLLHAELSAHRSSKNPMLLDAPSLANPQYHQFMARQFGARWTAGSSANPHDGISPEEVLDLISKFAAQEPLVYLHTSFGTLFELFADSPVGCIYHLSPRVPASVPVNPGGDTVKNEQLWQERWTNRLQGLAERIRVNTKFAPGLTPRSLTRLYLPFEANATALFIARAYSKRLNDWAVRMQRLGHPTEAEEWFRRAIQLNSDNLAAHINLKYAEYCRRGDNSPLKIPLIQREFSDLFQKYGSWRDILMTHGPVDEPSFLFWTSRLLSTGANIRQATVELMRCTELAPAWLAPKLLLAQNYIQLGDFAQALHVTDDIQSSNQSQRGPEISSLLKYRATALARLGRTNDAVACIESFINQYARHDEVISMAAGLYSLNSQFEKELLLLDELLRRSPKRPEILARKGLVQMELGRFEAAIDSLTKALAITPQNENMRLLRAVSCLGAEKLDAAREDYQELLRTAANPRDALFGLGTVAWFKQDTNQAIHYYQTFLSNNVLGTRQEELAHERLKQLQAGKR